MHPYRSSLKGFTLLEMLLVMVIVSAILLMLINYVSHKADETRRQDVVLKMQTILNAAAAYYLQTGAWPKTPYGMDWGYVDNEADLIKYKYLPSTDSANGRWVTGYGVPYWTGADTATQNHQPSNNFYVITGINPSSTMQTDAEMIAAQLPFGVIHSGNTPIPPRGGGCPDAGQPCMISAFIPVPAPILNTVRTVNFSNIYHNGACVPAPRCLSGMKPAILALPVAVSGTNDGGTANVYPINSYTAYALPSGTGSLSGAPVTSAALQATTCPGANATDQICSGTGFNDSFWRVCLAVTTKKGQVNNTAPADNKTQGSILVMTRCVPYNDQTGGLEPRGSDIGLW